MSGLIEITEDETHVEKKYMEWDIHDFHQFSRLNTAPFCFIGRMWYLEISAGHYQDTHISLFLYSKDGASKQLVTFTVGMKYLEKDIKRETLTKNFDSSTNIGYGSRTFYPIESFLKLCENEPEINLTVYCYLEYHSTKQFVADAECQTELYNTTLLRRNFEELLASGQQSDVTFEVHDRQFKAHKSILVARSSVFASMFGHDMWEKNDDVVRIEDYDPAVFLNFLQCMYTGNVNYASTADLISLYTAAYEYGVTDLKEACVHFIMAELSADSACDFLVLADEHNETEMRTCIEKFLIENLKKIIPTRIWQTFMSEHSSLAQEMLIKSLSISG